MTLALAVTAFRETTRGNGQWLLECIAPALECEHVAEVLVIDDGSRDWTATAQSLPAHPKLSFFHLGTNQCVFGSKIASVCHCHSDWVQLCDSDNIMDAAHFERLLELIDDSSPSVWYSSSFAKPVFDYTHLASETPRGIHGFAALVGKTRFDCLANTGNQCVNRAMFDSVFRPFLGNQAHLMFPNFIGVENMDTEEYRQTFNALDSFLLNLHWLTCGGQIHVVPGLEYFHRVTDQKQDSNYNRGPDDKDALGKQLLLELSERGKRTQ